MTTMHPMGEEDDEDLLLESDEQQEAPQDEHDDERQPDEEQAEDDQDAARDEEEEAPRPRTKAAKDKAEYRERQKQKAIRQRHALQEERRQRQELERRLAEREQRISELEASTSESEIARIDREIEYHEQAFRSAAEMGDTAAQAQASRALGRLEAERVHVSRSAPKKPSAPPQNTNEVDVARLPLELRAWSARHGNVQTWADDERQILMEVAQDIHAEGYEGVELLAELETRLRPLLPHRIAPAPQRKAAPRGQAYDLRNAPPAAPAPTSNAGGQAPRVGPGRQLTSWERSLMKQMGRDPKNPNHVAAFLRANPQARGPRRVER